MNSKYCIILKQTRQPLPQTAFCDTMCILKKEVKGYNSLIINGNTIQSQCSHMMIIIVVTETTAKIAGDENMTT